MNRTTRLRSMLQRKEIGFLMEAHSGLSAKIVEEAGFEGIWASGLSMSAALGVRDHNEASWTQVLEVAEFMADATTIPILVDGDTGFGDFNSMRRLVKKLGQRGVAGVCIEDKVFPKKNSFVGSARQPLAEIEEFAGKIKAGKDAVADDDFCIVARVEALIAGWGMDEALRRAEAYAAAGADAILIHSKERTPLEILGFLKAWGDRTPVVIVPTKYYTTPTEVFKDAGVSVVIWANHLMRASLRAMQQTAARIAADQTLLNVEADVAPLHEVFRLQGEPELEAAEKRYLPAARHARAVVLAASRGTELGALTQDRPKCMVQFGGRPLLERIVDTLRSAAVREIVAVRGYKKEAVDVSGVEFVDNDAWSTTAELASLRCAQGFLQGVSVVSYGDVLVRRHVLDDLLSADGDVVIAVDPGWRNSRNVGDRTADLVRCSLPHGRGSFLASVGLVEVSSLSVEQARAADDAVHGEWIGVLKLSPRGSQLVTALLDRLALDAENFARLKVPDLLRAVLADGEPIGVLYTAGGWLDVDVVEDIVGPAWESA